MAEVHASPPDGQAPSVEAIDQLRVKLENIVGAENVITDQAEREFYSQDIYKRGELVSLVIRPGMIDELSAGVAAATQAGFTVAPRGGGMSYTSGYIQEVPGAVMVDMCRMNRVKEINTEDMYVTVECGCTWSDLHEALKDKGVRTPFWGTLSGIRATVGGALSQNAIFFGSGQFGLATESVQSLKVVLADGTIVPTGTLSTKGSTPFSRHYGPDLTGLFAGDTGAFGFKAEATFRLIRKPAFEDSVSFAFDEYDVCADAICELTRAGIASEVFGFDPNLAEIRLKRESIMKDIMSLKGVATGGSSILEGVKDAAKVVLSGRRYMDEVVYTANAVVEGNSKAAVEAGIAEARRIGKAKGREIANSIPKIIRANPFMPLNNVLGPEGQRWIPIHGIVPLSKAKETWKKIYDLFAEYKERMDKYEIIHGFLISGASTNMFLIEPVMLWPDERFAIHERTLDDTVLKRIPKYDFVPEATALVDEIKNRLCRLFLEQGAAHLQIGKTYLYREGRDRETWKLLEGIKDLVDPQRRVNPGSLGLD